MLTLVAAVLAYDRARDMVETCRDMGLRLSSAALLRSRYVKSDTRDENDMLCGVLWVGTRELLAGEKDVWRRPRWFGKTSLLGSSRGLCSRGWNNVSIEGGKLCRGYGQGEFIW
jgi:hypothetical protein